MSPPPTSPLLMRLPTQVLWAIHDLLPLQDIRNLRLASRWFEDQLRRPFVERFYQNLYISKSANAANKIAFVLERPQFSAAVRALYIDCLMPTSTSGPYDQVLGKLQRLLSPENEGSTANTLDVGGIVAQLVGLQKLFIRRLTDTLELQSSEITRGLAVSGVHLTSLSLRDCEITCADVEVILNSHAQTLRLITFNAVETTGRDAWSHILRILHGMPHLSHCDLDGLHFRCGPDEADTEDEEEDNLDPETRAEMEVDRDYALQVAAQHAARSQLYHFLPNSEGSGNSVNRRYKWFRGPKGELEHYWVHVTKATMRGWQAVVAG
ncbi:hypothetical protein LTR85_006716 [Meristemomyces frigidus]|nr:hypothetical protein LTR85_006716 [Meristemomyces frigidus]